MRGSGAAAEVKLRAPRPEDRAAIESILKATGVFYVDEIGVALELLDIALNRPGQTDYIFLCAESDGRLAGYACYGPVPMTDRTYDLYWIAVDPVLHGRGVGRALMEQVEEDLRRRRARMLFIETGGREAYAPTRRFYEAIGYRIAATLPEFYRAGDDKVVFVKDLDRP